jgi:hypothetical protein
MPDLFLSSLKLVGKKVFAAIITFTLAGGVPLSLPNFRPPKLGANRRG